jgi:hypothetical protein
LESKVRQLERAVAEKNKNKASGREEVTADGVGMQGFQDNPHRMLEDKV